MQRFLFMLIFCLDVVGITTSSSQVASDFFFPLSVGNSWSYHTSSHASGWEPRTIREAIEGTDPVGGRQYYREVGKEMVDSHPSDSTIFHVFWLRADSLGNILIGAYSDRSTNIDSATLVPPGSFFPNEYLTVGYSFEYPQPFSDYYLQDSVLSRTETVNVPAGTFINCLEIREQHRDTLWNVLFREYAFYAPGVGEVKRVRVIPASEASVNELVQYNGVASVQGKDAESVTDRFALDQNYPNPFNPSTNIQFTIPVGTYGCTSLRVYDVLGKEVATLVNEKMKPGRYERNFDGTGLASGVYFYRLDSGSFTSVKRLLLLK